jgi:hypothetical protein
MPMDGFTLKLMACVRQVRELDGKQGVLERKKPGNPEGLSIKAVSLSISLPRQSPKRAVFPGLDLYAQTHAHEF